MQQPTKVLLAFSEVAGNASGADVQMGGEGEYSPTTFSHRICRDGRRRRKHVGNPIEYRESYREGTCVRSDVISRNGRNRWTAK